MHSFLTILGTAGLAAAHGLVDSYVVDGTKYPSFDARVDMDFQPTVKRISWGSKTAGGPINDVNSADITCRAGPFVAPALTAVARAGSKIDIKWTDWFGNHKGPLFTYMGLLPNDDTKLQDVGFFKIDEATYDPATEVWGTDRLIKNNNTWTVTIPSDIKPGNYIVRHESIALHNSWMENKTRKTSGAQHYPNCFKVQVTGAGTAMPPTVKFPGAYHWNDAGILINIYYGPKQYISPGPPVYVGARDPPAGPAANVIETGALTGELAQKYAALRVAKNKGLMTAVHETAAMAGGGGCHWEAGADPSTMKCKATNPEDPARWAGFAQPVGSPLWVEKPGTAQRGPAPPKTFETWKPET
ncbi:hypothetical protein BT63DRAFT_449290 [Microthyrium microscopicum]|uniref:lytic cellulose monooxygenase (C4-dehydrogenating) n=1 Tax=Microthyrium microscopicum TaxID=703497 RepID=A0A6A6UPT3_9PEZI|nr:hypothetical protein BT63DRAFT_449290 [Microthyrium microscopicum]